jgi:hypothetical protein
MNAKGLRELCYDIDTICGCAELMPIRPLLFGIAMTGMFGRGAPAIEQMPAPQSASTPRLDELWKTKLNANTV